jgi:acylphosphatase
MAPSSEDNRIPSRKVMGFLRILQGPPYSRCNRVRLALLHLGLEPRSGWLDSHPEMPGQRDISEETNYNSMKRLRAFVSGTVQKTDYRAKVVSLANFLGLVGFVQNLPDGRVKVVAEGEDPILERFLNDLRIKDPLIDVQDIEVNYTSASGDFVRFEKMVANGETDQRLDKAAELLSDLIVVNKQMVAQLMVNNEEIKGVREEVKGVREEVKGSREDINRVCESTQDIAQKITSSSELIAEKIDEAREEIISEVKELRSDLKDDLKERLVRMEADVSQIKARIGL